jgi:hypothetical protein
VRFTIAEPDEQRNRGDDFKVEQRLRAHAPYFFQVAAPAIPTTSVEKISGAMIDLIRLRKMSRRK